MTLRQVNIEQHHWFVNCECGLRWVVHSPDPIDDPDGDQWAKCVCGEPLVGWNQGT
jgi:hypothetical protein